MIIPKGEHTVYDYRIERSKNEDGKHIVCQLDLNDRWQFIGRMSDEGVKLLIYQLELICVATSEDADYYGIRPYSY